MRACSPGSRQRWQTSPPHTSTSISGTEWFARLLLRLRGCGGRRRGRRLVGLRLLRRLLRRRRRDRRLLLLLLGLRRRMGRQRLARYLLQKQARCERLLFGSTQTALFKHCAAGADRAGGRACCCCACCCESLTAAWRAASASAR